MKYGLERLWTLPWQAMAVPLAVLAATLGVGWLVERTLLAALRRHSERTKTALDDIVISTLSGPFMVWVLILGLHLALQASGLPASVLRHSGKVFLALWVVSLTIALMKFASGVIRHYGSRLQGTLPVTSLTENLARMAAGVLGAMLLLRVLGVEVTPLLATLGVGGLAVALALQDTLANLFAGVYISLARQVRVGDYIRLDSGEEGYVTDITWRSTAIRTLPNNMVFIPNSKLSQANVTNYSMPESRMSLLIPVGVSYDCDPEHVERVLTQVAESAAGEVPGLLTEPKPFVRFIPGFGDSSLNFTLICQVREFVDQYAVQHELRKRIYRRFREEGIEIPFPIRTVYLRQDAQAPVPLRGRSS